MNENKKRLLILLEAVFHRLYSVHVRQSGFEPETLCLEGRCSIQLSYWRFQDVTKVGK